VGLKCFTVEQLQESEIGANGTIVDSREAETTPANNSYKFMECSLNLS
jgi:hypothetical protein